MPTIKINPLQLHNPEHAQLMALLLGNNLAENWFFAGEIREVLVPRPPKTPRLVRVQLSYPLMRTGKTFAVIDNHKLHSEPAMSEKGIQDGGVYAVLGKIYLENGLAFCRSFKTPRVFKRMQYQRDGDQINEFICDSFDREENALRRIHHLFAHDKKVLYTDAVVEDSPTMKAGLIIKRVDGIPFCQFLNQYDYTLSTLYLLSIRLLRALHEQIHAVGLVHCDINSPNIIIDPKTLTISMIDLGSAHNIGVKLQHRVGNRDFSAPEVELAQLGMALTPATDAYSVALFLRQLCWNGGKRFSDNAHETYESDLAKLHEALKSEQEPALNTPLFDSIAEEDLPQKNRLEIRRVLDGLNQFAPGQRLNLPDAVAELEISYTHYREVKYLGSGHQFDQARLAALEFRAFSAQLLVNNVGLNWPAMLTEKLVDVLKSVHYGNAFVKHFTEIAGIKAFHGITCKEDILAKAQSILKDSEENTKKLLNSIQSFQAAKAWFKQHRPREVAIIKEWTCDYNKYLKLAQKMHLSGGCAPALQQAQRLGFDELEEFNRQSAIYSARMQAKAQQLQKLLKRYKAGYVATYADIMLKLKPQKDVQDELGQLKNQLRLALAGYLDARKGLTRRRQQDVKQFIDIAEKSASCDQLRAALNERIPLIRTGFWNRSKLRNRIQLLLNRQAHRG